MTDTPDATKAKWCHSKNDYTINRVRRITKTIIIQQGEDVCVYDAKTAKHVAENILSCVIEIDLMAAADAAEGVDDE